MLREPLKIRKEKLLQRFRQREDMTDEWQNVIVKCVRINKDIERKSKDQCSDVEKCMGGRRIGENLMDSIEACVLHRTESGGVFSHRRHKIMQKIII
jgi:hypothetical protein